MGAVQWVAGAVVIEVGNEKRVGVMAVVAGRPTELPRVRVRSVVTRAAVLRFDPKSMACAALGLLIVTCRTGYSLVRTGQVERRLQVMAFDAVGRWDPSLLTMTMVAAVPPWRCLEDLLVIVAVTRLALVAVRPWIGESLGSGGKGDANRCCPACRLAMACPTLESTMGAEQGELGLVMVEATFEGRPIDSLPAGGAVTRVACIRHDSVVDIAMAGVAPGKSQPHVLRAGLSACSRSRFVASFTSYAPMEASKPKPGFGMVKCLPCVPRGRRVAIATFLVDELATVWIVGGVAVAARRPEPQECPCQRVVLPLERAHIGVRDKGFRMALAAVSLAMRPLEGKPRLTMIERRGIEPHQLECDSEMITVARRAVLTPHTCVVASVALNPIAKRCVTREALLVGNAALSEIMALRTMTNPLEGTVGRGELAGRDHLSFQPARGRPHADRGENEEGHHGVSARGSARRIAPWLTGGHNGLVRHRQLENAQRPPRHSASQCDLAPLGTSRPVWVHGTVGRSSPSEHPCVPEGDRDGDVNQQNQDHHGREW